MEINYIQTLRKIEKKTEWDLVFEWEDVLKDELSLKFKYESKLSKYKNGIVKYSKINPFILEHQFRDDIRLRFDMNAKDYNNYYNRPDMIHWIIDFWIKDNELINFEKSYNKCPLTLISSKEVYDLLKSKDINLNIAHLPLSIPDRYKISPTTEFSKSLDLLIFGRPNPVLASYCWKYANENKNFTFAFLKREGNNFNYFTNKGKYLGNCRNREDAFKLLQSAKIGLYTTPSMDNNKANTNGYNQVTPRFLELIASGCHVISRHVDNSDTEYYELNKFCPNTTSYSHFVDQVETYLTKKVDMNLYSKYLNSHYTSQIAKKLNSILKSI